MLVCLDFSGRDERSVTEIYHSWRRIHTGNWPGVIPRGKFRNNEVVRKKNLYSPATINFTHMLDSRSEQLAKSLYDFFLEKEYMLDRPDDFAILLGDKRFVLVED